MKTVNQQLLFSILFLSLIIAIIVTIITLSYNSKNESGKSTLTHSEYRDLSLKYSNIK